MTNYNVVPDIITSKDMDYLSDMFNWNYDAFKCTYNSLDKITDEEIRSMMNRVSDVLRNNMNSVLSILGGNHE